ncbi:MAG: acetoacetate--CoA ligase [Candidatus Hydrogenedentota bacterium]|nr:MAG: acetoacetate--CoA ligase [Candidatus Hydrogenedentota bacterium]
MDQASILWQPKNPENSQLAQFMQAFGKEVSRSFSNYSDLHSYSVENPDAFWTFFLQWSNLHYEGNPSPAVANCTFFAEGDNPSPTWFPNVKISMAENMLRGNPSQIAIIEADETGIRREISYQNLKEEVAKWQAALKAHGFQKGDVFAALMPNCPETLIAFLAVNSLGGIFTSTSPDFGVRGILDRFQQVQPKFLLTVDGYFYKQKQNPLYEKLSNVIKPLKSLQKVIVLPRIEDDSVRNLDKVCFYSDFLSEKASTLKFLRLSFQDPIWIMYSSGTTGLPKCIVQGHGAFINHVKEHRLHTDLRERERFFYFTTCGWMMWNWLISGLASNATLILYDGNPLYPQLDSLFQLAEETKMNIFGTSARYITYLRQNNADIRSKYSLENLRAILSTGSVLPPEGFDYVYDSIKKDIQLCSISGGTDLNGCFALGNPLLPVYRGELQCRGLGMAVQVYDDSGKPVIEKQGELVCEKPFPSMPLYFHNDVGFSKYRAAYFEKFKGVWAHGDFALLTKRGSMIFYGRSDATLNPGGVRIGTAEIYRAIADIPEIEDSVVVGQRHGNDERVILFVKLAKGKELSEDLISRIQKQIRSQASPRHVPSIILTAPDIPYTISMKKVEIAIRRILEGQDVKNKDALMNPEALEYFYKIRDSLNS